MKTTLISLLFCFIASSVSAIEKPNVILIMADDAGIECFPAYGGEDYETPRLDEIAENGIVFDNCYSQPLCTPSRVKIMTGKYQYRNYTHFGYLGPDQKTIGHLMQAAGYKTAVAGKWQLNGLYDKHPGYDDPSRPVHFGFDEYHLWQLTQGKKLGERYWNTLIETNGRIIGKEQTRGKYGPDLHQQFIGDFMERNKDEAFFIYYPMVLVHSPFLPTPDSKDPACKDKKQNIVDMVKYTDKIIGEIIDKTEELGIAENTLILFTCDNGTESSITSRWKGQDITGGKGTMQNAGTHVPLYAYWKGVTNGPVRCNEIIEFSDFYSTLAELSGQVVPASDYIDGVSFLPEINGEKRKPRDWIVCHYTPYWSYRPDLGRYVRDNQYKLYQDGRFYLVKDDLNENNELSNIKLKRKGRITKKRFQKIQDQMPEFPDNPVKENKVRPIYPKWDPLD